MKDKQVNSRTRKPVKIPTPERLANIALYYLSRYAASESSLRRVLQNRIRRAAMRDQKFASDIEKHNQLHLAIEMIVEKHRKSGILNDAAYAEMKVQSLRRGGRSKRAIEQKLSLKGIKRNVIAEALNQNDGEENEEAEINAAKKWAQKKRLGPHRTRGKADTDTYRKDLASMARAGFSLDVARKVLTP